MVIWVSQAKHLQNLLSHLRKHSFTVQLIISTSHLHECTEEEYLTELLPSPVYSYSSETNCCNVQNTKIILVNWRMPQKIPGHWNSVTCGDTLLRQSLRCLAIGQTFWGAVQERIRSRDALFQKFSVFKCRWGLVLCQLSSVLENSCRYSNVCCS